MNTKLNKPKDYPNIHLIEYNSYNELTHKFVNLFNMIEQEQKKQKYGKHLEIILRKLAEVIGADFNAINSCQDWWKLYTWSEEQENEFKEWMVDYLHKSLEARREICDMPSFKSKKHLKKVVDFFVMNYGWIVK